MREQIKNKERDLSRRGERRGGAQLVRGHRISLNRGPSGGPGVRQNTMDARRYRQLKDGGERRRRVAARPQGASLTCR
jgi:hypothetical protein